MTLPSLILSPQASRTRHGTVEPALSGAVAATADGWRLFRGLDDPSLVLSPHGSYGRAGPISPSQVVGTVAEIAGEHGPAWSLPAGAYLRFTGLAGPVLGAKHGTVLVRMRHHTPVAADRDQINLYLRDDTLTAIAVVGRYRDDSARPGGVSVVTQGNGAAFGDPLPDNTWLSHGYRYNLDSVPADYAGFRVWGYQNGVRKTTTGFPLGRSGAGITNVVIGEPTGVFHHALDVAAVAVWDHDLDEAEIARLHALPAPWGPDGAITLPHPQPVGDLLVRYREAGLVRSVRLHGPGHVGASGLIAWADGELVIIGDGFELLGLVAWPAAASLTRFGEAVPAGPATDAGKIEEAGELFLLDPGLGDPTLLLTPGASHDLGGPVAETLSGSARVIDTEHGPAWQTMDPVTNYAPNPRLADVHAAAFGWDEALNGPPQTARLWSTYNGGVPEPHIGYHAHVIEGGGPNDENALALLNLNSQFGHSARYLAGTMPLLGLVDPAITAGAKVTVSFDYKAEAVGLTISVGLYHRSIATGNLTFSGSRGPVVSTVADQWERRSITFTVDADWDTTQIPIVYLYGMEGLEGRKWVANVQVEIGPYATPLAVGDLGAGFAWAATPYQSNSIRTWGYVAATPVAGLPWTTPYTGSVLIRGRYWPSGPDGAQLDQTAVWAADSANQARFRIGRYRDEGVSFVSNGNGRITPPPLPHHTWLTQGYRHAPFTGQGAAEGGVEEGGWGEIFVDGALVNSRHSPAHHPMTDIANIRLGYQGTNLAGNVEVAGVLWYAEGLSDAEMARLSDVPGPWSWDDRAGRLHLPLGQPPAEILVATRSGETTTITRLGGPGETDRLSVRYAPGLLTLLATAETELLAVVIDPTLDDAVAERILQADVWSWNTVIGAPAGVIAREVDLGLSVIPHTVELPLAVIPGKVKHG